MDGHEVLLVTIHEQQADQSDTAVEITRYRFSGSASTVIALQP